MLIQFNETRRFSPDGHTVQRGLAGQVLDVPHTAATGLIRDGHAICKEPQKTLDEITAEVIAASRKSRGVE